MSPLHVAARGFGAERHGGIEQGVHLRLAPALQVPLKPRGNLDREAQLAVAQPAVELLVAGQRRFSSK